MSSKSPKNDSAEAVAPAPSDRDVIRRPDAAAHYMALTRYPGTVTARFAGKLVAKSERALQVSETWQGKPMSPTLYFPAGDVQQHLLTPTENRSSCPLKGSSVYLRLHVGDSSSENAAWSYDQVLDFDPRLAELEGAVAFDSSQVEISHVASPGRETGNP